MFRLAIIHYHLNRGGVTRVITNQLAALNLAVQADGPLPVLLLYGGRAVGWPPEIGEQFSSLDLELAAVPALDYDESNSANPNELAEEIQRELRQRGFEPSETLIHVHNHSLGKNVALPEALSALADSGYRLFLQIHDFAEDLRPDNYRRLVARYGTESTSLYPQAPHIHYATLNARDYDVLRSAGAEQSRLHLLPNPVLPPDVLPERRPVRVKLADEYNIGIQQRLAVYPVRAIRRKNLGEVLLLSIISPENTTYGVTLSPINPRERPGYLRWRDLAHQLRLPCLFDLGEHEQMAFGEILAAADMLVSTSVTEGFGMVFLEAWLCGRPLVGRDLPEITRDFRQAGLAFPGMYDRLDVPVDWVGADAYRATMERWYRTALDAFGQPVPESKWLARKIEQRIVHGCVDFADLDEELQARVIEQTTRSRQRRQELAERCSTLVSWVSATSISHEQIADNAKLVMEHYSLNASSQRLWQVYETLARAETNGPRRGLPAPERILGAFLGFERFRPLRVPP